MSNGNTEIAAPTADIMDRPITYRPFMGNADIVLTANSVLKLIAKPTKNGKMPTAAQAIRFAKLCEARGLNPWEGDAFLVGYDSKDGPEFNLITAHQAFMKRAEVHPEYDGMESGVVLRAADGAVADVPGDFVDDGQSLVGGWARVHFKERKVPTYRRLKLATFSTGYSRWIKDPAGMIVKCAEADALRSSFPTKLGGMYLREEFDAMIETPQRLPVAMPRAIGHHITEQKDAASGADVSDDPQHETSGGPAVPDSPPFQGPEPAHAGQPPEPSAEPKEPAEPGDAKPPFMPSSHAELIAYCQSRAPCTMKDSEIDAKLRLFLPKYPWEKIRTTPARMGMLADIDAGKLWG